MITVFKTNLKKGYKHFRALMLFNDFDYFLSILVVQLIFLIYILSIAAFIIMK